MVADARRKRLRYGRQQCSIVACLWMVLMKKILLLLAVAGAAVYLVQRRRAAAVDVVQKPDRDAARGSRSQLRRDRITRRSWKPQVIQCHFQSPGRRAYEFDDPSSDVLRALAAVGELHHVHRASMAQRRCVSADVAPAFG
jgi:hypothetical protein